MANSPGSEWLTVSQVAETLGTSTETVRRMIKAGKLPASRASALPRAPWLINGPAWEQQKRDDEIRARTRERMAGVVVGRSDEGGPADEAFIAEVGRLHGPDTAMNLRQVMDRHHLFDYLEREMREDPAVRQRLETLDDDERIEAAAQELARRVREHERIQRRAQEILDEEDE